MWATRVVAGDTQTGDRRPTRNAVRFDIIAFILYVPDTGTVASDARRTHFPVARHAPLDDGNHMATRTHTGFLQLLVDLWL
jgi:hypothetical protein